MSPDQILYAGNFEPSIPDAVKLDLEGEESIPVTLKVADIRNIVTRQGSRTSQAIKLPGTEVNNKFFGGIYDINADFEIFNPNEKVSCRYIVDSEILIEGFLQLKSIDVNDEGEITYNVTLFDQVADFYKTLNDKTRRVRDLDWSSLNHDYTRTNIKNSWSNDWNLDHLGSPGGGYTYPFFYDPNPDGSRKIEEFQPAFFYKLALQKAVASSHPDYPAKEYTMSGDFIDNVRFDREIIPYSGDKPTVSDAVAASKHCFVAIPLQHEILDLVSGGSGSTLISITTGPIPFTKETPAPLDDSNGLFTTDTFTAPSTGLYKFSVNLGMTVRVEFTTSDTDEDFSELVCKSYARLVLKDEFGDPVYPTDTFRIFAEPGANPMSTEEWLGYFAVPLDLVSPDGGHVLGTLSPIPNITGTFAGPEEGGAIWLQENWTAEIQVVVYTRHHNYIGDLETSNPSLLVTRVQFRLEANSTFRSEKIKNAYSEGETIVFSDFIDPNLKQKDLLDDIVARYNVYVHSNPDDPDDLVFDTRDEFYAKGPVYDWTSKHQNANRDQIRMIGELQNAEMLFTYKKAGDAWNKQYSDAVNGDIYGQFSFIFSNEFVKGTNKIETPFEPTPFVRQPLILDPSDPESEFNSTCIVPAIDIVEPKTKFRVLYSRKGLLTDDVSVDQDGSESVQWLLKYHSATGTPVEELIVGYPYSGHYDHPINPTFSINFGNPELVLAEMLSSTSGAWTPPPNTMFWEYWRNTVQQLAKGQMLIADFLLTPNDVANIRKNPNARIFLKNTYFYINQIKFEGNQNLRKLARVELITVEDQIQIPLNQGNYGGASQDGASELFDPPGGLGPTQGGGIGRPKGNTYGAKSDGVDVRGHDNVIGGGGKNLRVVGDGNYVTPGAKNVVIENGDNNKVFGNNITIKNASGIEVFGNNLLIDGDQVFYKGKSDLLFNVLDGGKNTVRSQGAQTSINIVDGGQDGQKDVFNTTTSINVIDSDTGINDEINFDNQ